MKNFAYPLLLLSLLLIQCGPELARSSQLASEQATDEDADISIDFLLANGVGTSEFPEVVLVYIQGNPPRVCTGSFVGSNAVLTAAHCLYSDNASDYYIFTGTKFADTKRLSQAIKVKKFIGDRELGKKPILLPNESARDLAILLTDESENKIAKISTTVVRQNSKLVGVGYGLHTEQEIDYLPRKGNFLSTDASDVPANFRPSLINTLSGLRETFNLSGDSGGPKFLDGKIVAVVSAGGKTGSKWLGRNTALSSPFALSFLENAKNAGAKIGVQGAPPSTKPVQPMTPSAPTTPVAQKPTEPAPAAPKPTEPLPDNKPESVVGMPPKQTPPTVEPPKTNVCQPVAAFINSTRREDVNGSGNVTALDALNVINAINRIQNTGKTIPYQLVEDDSKFKVDVSGDGCLNNDDAQLVIQYLSKAARNQ